MKKAALAFSLCVCFLLWGCAAPAQPVMQPEKGEAKPEYALVVKDTGNPYMVQMYEGFAEACAELGAQARMVGPGAGSNLTQEECLRALTREGVSAIAIAANDSASVSGALKEAREAGIAVVSLDSVVDPADRKVHIQQASPEVIGRVLIQAGTHMIGGQGQIAILTTTEAMPNQSSWVRWMLYELEHQPDQYAGISLAGVFYGLDEYEASAAETRKLLSEYPDLKLIIAPTVVGLRAAAELVAKSGAGVTVTGLGLPSEMEPYIVSGISPWMYLWNPSEVGYLAAYASHGLVNGSLTGEIGEILSAGTLGDKVVTLSEDGGSEIVLGNPKMFDETNIAMWKEVF